MEAAQRTLEEITASTAYGDLYQVMRVHSDKFIAGRVRRKKDKLFVHTDEIVTMLRTDHAKLTPIVGDFCFRDRAPAAKATWSLWAVRGDL